MFTVTIPRSYVSKKQDDAGVKLYFDVALNDETGTSHRINGFRLVHKDDKKFIGFPSVVGKDGKRYPSFIPSKPLSEAIQVAAEVEYSKATKVR